MFEVSSHCEGVTLQPILLCSIWVLKDPQGGISSISHNKIKRDGSQETKLAFQMSHLSVPKKVQTWCFPGPSPFMMQPLGNLVLMCWMCTALNLL